MSDPFEAAGELAAFLDSNGLPYVVIGGLAVQIWGEPRFTLDADLTVAASIDEGIEPVVRLITSRFESRLEDALDFARKTRMILVRTAAGIDVDISLSLPGYEDDLFSRAVTVESSPGKRLKICSAEDLIVHKALAGRPQDLRDLRSVILRQGDRLDLAYIRRWLAEFSILLDEGRISQRFEEAMDADPI